MREFGDRLGGEDHVAIGVDREFDFLAHHRQTSAVGGDHGQLAFLKRHQQAAQGLAGLVLGDGVTGLAQHVLEFNLLDLVAEGTLFIRNRGEVDHRHALDLVHRPTGGDQRIVVFIDFHFNDVVGNARGDVEKRLDRNPAP